MIELSVIVPCLDEQDNLPELCDRVLRTFAVGELCGELVLVDDGSQDDTRAVVERLGRAHPEVVGVFHDVNRGIAEAWKSGLGAARGELVALIDADLQYQPEDLLRLRRALYQHSVDIAQGWRSAVGRAKGPRYYYSRGFNHLLNGVFRMRLQDNKSGFVMCGREVLADLLTYRGSYHYWQSFIMVAAKAKGYSYKSIETLFDERRQGRSFLDGRALSASAKSLVDVSRAAWEYRLSAGPPDAAHQLVRRYRPRPRPARQPASWRWRTYLALFHQAHWMITRDVEHHLETLERTQWLTADQLRELQDEKLRRLIRHCYRNVPFYRRRMQERGLHPEDIRTQADLLKLAFTTKADLRRNLYFDVMSENHDKSQVLRITTSGSTGEPFVCYADRRQLEIRWAATLRAQRWTGYRFGDPTVRLWHQTLGMSNAQVRQERLDALLSCRHFVPIFDLDERRIERALELLRRVQPTLLDGYAEALDLLARHAVEHVGAPVRAGAVMSSAQTLPDSSRRMIEQAFGGAVFDKYGAREFSGIAYECERHAGHHVVAESYIVEVLREGRPAAPGEVGEVVITDLNNFCMPFVRYRIGDLAEAMADEPCACGRGAPRVGAIEGRLQSIIHGTGGRYLPGTFFAHYFKDLAHAVKRYQVVQEQPDALLLKIVKGGRYSPRVREEVLDTLRRHLGRSMRIEVELVDEVAMVRTGKRVASISTLPLDLQADGAPVITPPGGNGA